MSTLTLHRSALRAYEFRRGLYAKGFSVLSAFGLVTNAVRLCWRRCSSSSAWRLVPDVAAGVLATVFGFLMLFFVALIGG